VNRCKKTVVLTVTFFAAAALIIAVGGISSANQALETTHQPADHDFLPAELLPVTLDPAEFKENRAAFVVYTLASHIPKILYQEPCYCGCDRAQGHQSLLDCFTGKHGILCRLCQKEAIFCFELNRKGKSPAQIRKAISSGDTSRLNVEQYVDRYYRNARRGQ
jgi:hypothetical protein